MVYKLPIDLYQDWKDLMYTKELFENIVEELKEQANKDHINNHCKREMNNMQQPKYPCRNCIYFKACGETTRTMPCKGRQTKKVR